MSNKEFDTYLNKYDFVVLLDNLKQRSESKLAKSYVNRVIQGYYSIFLANANEEISKELIFIS